MPEDAPPGENAPATSERGTFRMFPDSVLLDPRLSHGARITYALLCKYKFENKPYAQLTIHQIALQLAYEGDRRIRTTATGRRKTPYYSTRSAIRWIAELMATGHIERLAMRKGQAARYLLKSSDNLVTAKKGRRGSEVVTPVPQSSDNLVTPVVTPVSPYTIRTPKLIPRRSSYVKNNEVNDRLLEMRQRETGWPIPVVAKDLCKALSTVGLENQQQLIDHYRYALERPSFKQPFKWAISKTKQRAL